MKQEKTLAEIDVTADDALVSDAVRVLDEIGMDMETAVRVFLKQVWRPENCRLRCRKNG